MNLWIRYWIPQFWSCKPPWFKPYVEELTIGHFKISFPLRLYLLFLCSMRSFTLFGECSLLMTLKTLCAILARHWLTSDSKPILFRKSRKGVCVSLTTKWWTCSLTFFSFAVAPLFKKWRLWAVVEVRNDTCEVKTFSCFQWEDLFHPPKHGNLLGDFLADICYLLLKFQFIWVVCWEKPTRIL